MWMAPRGMTVPEASADARVGRPLSVTMQARDGSRFAVGGEYRGDRPPESRGLHLAVGGRADGGHADAGRGCVHQPGRRHIAVDAPAASRGGDPRSAPPGMERDAEPPDRAPGSARQRGDADVPRRPRSTYTRTARMGWPRRASRSRCPCGPHTPEIRRPSVRPHSELRDGEFGLFETSAIPLCRRGLRRPRPCCPAPSPTGALRAGISATNAYLYDNDGAPLRAAVHLPRGEGGKPDAGVIGAALKEMPAQLAALDDACARSDLAGPSVSMADLFVAPTRLCRRHAGGQDARVGAQSDAPQARVRERPELRHATSAL